MSIDLEPYTINDRNGSLLRFAQDADDYEGYDYKKMRDICDLRRNKHGDRFFDPDSVEPDTYYITPKGHFLARIGPRDDPNYPWRKSLVRCGHMHYGYCTVTVRMGGKYKHFPIHHLVYSAFGDVSIWDTGRLDHTPDPRRTNNDINNLQPSTAQSDAFTKQTLQSLILYT